MKPTYLVFDTETTGVPAKGQYDNPRHPQTPKLVELGALLLDHEFNELDSMEVIVRPYYEGGIPTSASDIHGITTERAMSEGVELRNAFLCFEYLASFATHLVAHNFSYDSIVMLGVAFHLDDVDRWPNHLSSVCTKDLTTPICRIPNKFRGGGYKWPKLQEAHLHFFGTEFEGAHGAMADLRATARVLQAIIQHHPDLYDTIHASGTLKGSAITQDILTRNRPK